MTECIVIEKSMQISAEDAPVARDASIRQCVCVIALASNGCKRPGAVEILRRAQVNLVAADFTVIDWLAE